jgi:outer membrane protein assembly factor BamE (lipoprotein component of BamABCDE complex)
MTGRGLAALGLVLALAACEPILRSHGYTPSPEKLAQISEGVDTRGSVQRKIGRPAMNDLYATDDAWYYVSSIVKEESYKAPVVIDRKVVAIEFDEQGIVTGVGQFGLEDGQIVDLVTRTTPTYGSQLTILEQLFGNIGANTGEALLDN